jgi:hypothetical protein
MQDTPVEIVARTTTRGFPRRRVPDASDGLHRRDDMQPWRRL